MGSRVATKSVISAKQRAARLRNIKKAQAAKSRGGQYGKKMKRTGGTKNKSPLGWELPKKGTKASKLARRKMRAASPYKTKSLVVGRRGNKSASIKTISTVKLKKMAKKAGKEKNWQTYNNLRKAIKSRG